MQTHSNGLEAYANGSVTFQLPQEKVVPGKAPISVLLYINITFIKRSISILQSTQGSYTNVYMNLYQPESNNLVGMQLIQLDCLNNDSSVMSWGALWPCTLLSAWRLLGLLH